ALTPAQMLPICKAGMSALLREKSNRATCCMTSRSPPRAELHRFSRARGNYFRRWLGDLFNARIAGNIADPDLVGSMEFACAVSGAKLVLVMGHTSCGAIKGACDKVELGNLTGLLEKIQ